jgi:hypothetical protein
MAFLVLAHLTLQTIGILSGHDYLFGLVPMFNLDAEQNLPTLFGVLLFLVSSLLCGFCGAPAGPRDVPSPPLLLAGLFGFLGLDEFLAWHEGLSELLRSSLKPRVCSPSRGSSHTVS